MLRSNTSMMLTRNKSRAGSSLVSNGTNGQKYLPEKCRVCLDDGEIPIFGVNDISDEVTEYGNIEIGKDDNLPQYLCEACYALLEAAILFRKTAKQSDVVLRRTNYSDSGSEDSDSKYEDEPYIKREYLELNYSSESELDDFDKIKRELESEDDTTNYNPTISEADTQDSNNCQDFLSESDIKIGDTCINEADNEMIMIIVSDKDKQKQAQTVHDNSRMDLENYEEITDHTKKSLMKILPHQIECEVCHSVVLKRSYREHLKGHRDKYREKCDRKYSKVECEFCGKKIGKSYLKHHMKMHGTPEEQADRFIECPICKKKFSTHYYADHVRRVHEKKNHNNKQTSKIVKMTEESSETPKFKKCPVCDKKLKESEYNIHVARHGGPLKRYICDKCGKVFKHPSAFKTHCLTHGSELKFKCQFCPYRGLHQALLKIHVRTHTGDYNYKCTECPARFITKSNLSKHLQRHKGLCNFKCEECGKGFYTKRDVEKHAKNVHLTVKNHICEVCGKGFGHRDNMLSHQLKVHKRDKIITRGRMPSYLKAELKHLE